MTREETKKQLRDGKNLSDLFCFKDFGDGICYKGSWEISDDVIYIQDVLLNELHIDRQLTAEEIEEADACMYTGRDFVYICDGNRDLAFSLFMLCNWQSPYSEANQFDDEEKE